MLRYCNLLSKVLVPSESRLISTGCRFLKDDESGDKSNPDNPASKLNALLLSIAKEDKYEPRKKIEVPKSRSKQRFSKPDKIAKSQKDLGTRIVDAAKQVANNIEGDKKEIEAKLLEKLLVKNTPVKDEIIKAAHDNKLLTDLLTNMNVEKETEDPAKPLEEMGFSKPSPLSGSSRFKSSSGKYTPRKEERVNLFGEKPLLIFDSSDFKEDEVQLRTWMACEERENKLSVTHPPSNYFEQMIDWTEKGIIWKFPIDNEQGLDSEKKVSFSSHVLLETHLDGWCPTIGPIRHFMELVCVGLSQNHWLSAQEKKDHIMWYKEFFLQRKQLIKEIGAGDVQDVNSLPA